ncbi:MAG: SH3 domain-containing protein [Caldilineaceae bacterium]|nr:SH3 domain-containing protein [Caldilineaceae bacterium]
MVTIGTTQMNVRAGPSLLYLIIGQAYPGEEFEVTGRNPGLGDWWEIKYRSEEVRGWVYSQLVVPRNTQNVAIAAVIPAEPTRTPTPPPTATPIPAPTQPPAPQFPYSIVNEGTCPGNAQQTYFEGNVFGRDRLPKNGVCVHISFHGPRNTKCTGCGKPAGAWGFSPFGGPANKGTFVEIWVVNCPAGGWDGLRHNSKDFTNLAPLSEKWTVTVNDSIGCKDINFREN